MARKISFLVTPFLLIVLGTISIASPVLGQDLVAPILSDRNTDSSEVCADPTLASTVYEGFTIQDTLHVLAFRDAFVNANDNHEGAPFFTFPIPMFKAWRTQQPSTLPLFHLLTPDTTDSIYVVGANEAILPVVSGFNRASVRMWVYNTSVCDSVPLMSAALSNATDHYFTTDSAEHAGLLADGWTDTGVVAFVLPPPAS